MDFSIQSQDSLLAYIKSNLLNNGQNLSIRGLARLCDVDDKALISSAEFASEKLSQKLVSEGFQAADLVENGFNSKATWLVIEYFAYESKAKAPGAKQIARTFGQIGVMTTFEKLSEVPQPVALPPVRQLPPVRDYIEHLEASKEIARLEDPILKSYLMQRLYEALGVPALPAEDDPLVVVSVLAKELGFQLKPGQDAILGKWVRKYHEPLGQTQNGKFSVNVYRQSEIVETVRAFFN